jgi:hypothetical protein
MGSPRRPERNRGPFCPWDTLVTGALVPDREHEFAAQLRASNIDDEGRQAEQWIRPLGQPKEAIGHESKIELWLTHAHPSGLLRVSESPGPISLLSLFCQDRRTVLAVKGSLRRTYRCALDRSAPFSKKTFPPPKAPRPSGNKLSIQIAACGQRGRARLELS